MFTTRHNRVAGLGNSNGSQRAMNMLFAIRTIQERTARTWEQRFIGNNYFQLINGIVSLIQVSTSQSIGRTEHPLV